MEAKADVIICNSGVRFKDCRRLSSILVEEEEEEVVEKRSILLLLLSVLDVEGDCV